MVCLSTLTFWLEAKSQYLHLYGFSPVCIIICLFMLALIPFEDPCTSLGQNGQRNLYFPLTKVLISIGEGVSKGSTYKITKIISFIRVKTNKNKKCI